MSKRRPHNMLVALLALFLLLPLIAHAQDALPEVPVAEIALSGPSANATAEISGLAWYGESLLLVLENPNDYADDTRAGLFFALDKADILAYLDTVDAGDDPAPLDPRPVPVYAPNLRRALPGFDGFEAAVFVEDRVFLSVEIAHPSGAFAYLVAGTVEGDLDSITLDLDHTLLLGAQTAFANSSYEALIAVDDMLIAVYEANGAGVNPDAAALLIDPATLDLLGNSAMPPIPYRLTDATVVDDDGVFWMANFFFPGDEHLATADDPLVAQYGEGATHARYPQVERLIAFTLEPAPLGLYSGYRIVRVDQPPVYLELPGLVSRNWEGIARLDERGFLLVTDRFPRTILAFVPAPTIR